MKKLPSILVMGRPNVGKSTLINKIIGKPKAITLDTPGVTRDLAYYPAEWAGKTFMLVDSGGILLEKTKNIYLQKQIEDKVKSASETAHKIIFLVDYKDGLHPQDHTIAKFLRVYSKKVILVVTKIDNQDLRFDTHEFIKLGFGQPMPVSGFHGTGTGDLMDKIIEEFDKNSTEKHEKWLDGSWRVAIVGRPNVGKSSLTNAILNEDRVIVDDKAGTTRDSIDVFFEHEGKKYVFVDTAGIRKKKKIEDGIEYYSVLRSSKSISTSDVTILVLEAKNLMSDQDKKIIQLILEAKRNLIVFVNKWDLVERTDQTRKDLIHIVTREFPALENFPFIFGSAQEGHNLNKLFELIPNVIENSHKRFSTSKVNDFVDRVILRNPPPSKSGKSIKVFYATQAGVHPPHFIFFVNDAKLVTGDYLRFLDRRIRAFFECFEGVALKLTFRTRERKEKIRPKQVSRY